MSQQIGLDEYLQLLIWETMYMFYPMFLFSKQSIMACCGTKMEIWLKCPVCQDTVRKPKTLRVLLHFLWGLCGAVDQDNPNWKRRGKVSCVCRAFTEQSQIKTNILLSEMLETREGI